MKKNLIQAYKQAPWRVQAQWIGLFLLGLVLVAAITGIYLNISAQAASAGRNIQGLESDIDDIMNEIAALTTDLAVARSENGMLTRADQLGFSLLDPRNAIYLEIPGLDPDQNLVLAPKRLTTISEAPSIKTSYTQSLWDWFSETFWNISRNAPQTTGEQEP
jgi:hypothetical protein